MKTAISARVPTLDSLANVAVILAAVIVAWVWVKSATATRPVGGVDARQLYSSGEIIGTDTGLTFDAPLTAVLFVHSQCQFCTRSMPFYTRVLTERNRIGSRTRVIAVAKEPQRSLEGYLQSHSLKPDGIVALDAASPFRLQLTPTLLIVERGGRIREIWTGQLTPEQETVALEKIMDSSIRDATSRQ